MTLVLACAVGIHAGAARADAQRPATPYVVAIDLTADIRALGADDPFVSEPAVERLVALGPPVLPALRAALREEPVAVRVGVVDVARQLDDPGAVELLITATRDADEAVRADALLALGTGAENAGRAAVEAALADPEARARRAAIIACARLCTSREAIAQLVALAIDDRESAAARHSLQVLPLRGSELFGRTFVAVTDGALPALSDPDAGRRVRAALAAAAVGHPDAVLVLAEAVRSDDPALVQEAVLALGGIPAPPAVAPLATLVQHHNASIANAACISLSRLKVADVAGATEALAPCEARQHAAATPGVGR